VGDRERFERINPRLLDNLGKALEIGGASKTKITKIMRQLKQVQEFTFHQAEHGATAEQSHNGDSLTNRVILATRNKKDVPALPRNDPDLRRVDKLAIGIWMEFRGIFGERVRCTLASKIDSIEKLFFADSEGKKVMELTRMRLAHELKAGTVKVVSEGSLVNRAMESVITNLKQTSAQKPRRQASA
jgi:K+/H+ antiporter YhaU regulatory subunit KhtT